MVKLDIDIQVKYSLSTLLFSYGETIVWHCQGNLLPASQIYTWFQIIKHKEIYVAPNILQ